MGLHPPPHRPEISTVACVSSAEGSATWSRSPAVPLLTTTTTPVAGAGPWAREGMVPPCKPRVGTSGAREALSMQYGPGTPVIITNEGHTFLFWIRNVFCTLWCLGTKYISNQEFWHPFEKGERCTIMCGVRTCVLLVGGPRPARALQVPTTAGGTAGGVPRGHRRQCC